jgi:hypothetical protein
MTGERLRWPPVSDTDGWAELANVAMQLETLQADLAESAAWEETMQELVTRRLPYLAFVAARQEALSARLRRRKLAQTNLRYKYGFKPRSARLVRRDVRRFLMHGLTR